MAIECTRQQAEAALRPGEQLWEASTGPCVFRKATDFFYVYSITTPHRSACLDTDRAYLSAERFLREFHAGWCGQADAEGMVDELLWVVVTP